MRFIRAEAGHVQAVNAIVKVIGSTLGVHRNQWMDREIDSSRVCAGITQRLLLVVVPQIIPNRKLRRDASPISGECQAISCEQTSHAAPRNAAANRKGGGIN